MKVDIVKRAILVIEEIATFNMGMCETPEEKQWALVYEFAHVARGTCPANHKPWRRKLNRMYRSIFHPRS